MCVYMYACIHVYMYVMYVTDNVDKIFSKTFLCIYVYICVCMCMYVYVCV